MLFKDLIILIEKLFPPHLAEDWDPIGLHFGHSESEVNHIMLSLDVRPHIVQEAIERGVDTLVVHHPPIFSKIDNFDLSDPQKKMYADIIKADLNVFAAHTNCDSASGGMNDWLAHEFGLERVTSLQERPDGEPGLGRIGYLKQALNREDLITKIKDVYQKDPIITIEKTPKDSYQKVAILGGSGSSFYKLAEAKGADLFITGDITYHTAHDLYETDMLTVDIGHYIEHTFVNNMYHILKSHLDVEVSKSNLSTDPYRYE